MISAYISVGSNHRDGANYIIRLFDYLRNLKIQFAHSQIYQTDSISGDGTRYYNAVIKMVTDKPSYDLNLWLKAVEKMFGRLDSPLHKQIVVMDLDLVVYGGDVLRPRDYDRNYFQIGYRQL